MQIITIQTILTFERSRPSGKVTEVQIWAPSHTSGTFTISLRIAP